MIVNSGVRRSLATSAYNDRRAACERAVAAVRTFAPDVRALRDVDERALEQRAQAMDEEAFRRASHVVAENRRPARFAAALERGDSADAGRVMLESHASLRDLYEVSCPELDLLVALSMEQKGCYGARLTGAARLRAASARSRSSTRERASSSCQPPGECRAVHVHARSARRRRAAGRSSSRPSAQEREMRVAVETCIARATLHVHS